MNDIEVFSINRESLIFDQNCYDNESSSRYSILRMSKILLVAINSSYQHPSFGLRYLYAQLGKLQEKAEIIEFTIKKPVEVIAEDILQLNPEIVGLGVYIWNANESLELCRSLKSKAPQIKIILGGPEVSFELESQDIFSFCDLVIQGEADLQFKKVLEDYFDKSQWPHTKVLKSQPPDVKTLNLPYQFYTDEDLTHRFVYIEASRGCPYLCEYCLSSLDKGVRSFDIDLILTEMDALISRGAKNFKFVDRTFNLNPTTCLKILNFFLSKNDPLLNVHFEMVPDRLPHEIRALLPLFKPGQIQFEIGIQTFNPEVAKNVSRKNDLMKVKENFEYLKNNTGIHTHADLIAGLPGETLASFSQGFDQLWSLKPNEIQLGILKRLKGAPIRRHEKSFELMFNSQPPYQILSTKHMTSEELVWLGRMARYWDLINNQGRFKSWISELDSELINKSQSPFWFFWRLTHFLWQEFKTDFGLNPWDLKEKLIEFCKIEDLGIESCLKKIDFQKPSKSRQDRHWNLHD